MGFFKSSTPTPPKPNQYVWDVLVKLALTQNGMSYTFTARSYSGPVKVILGSLDEIIHEQDFVHFMDGHASGFYDDTHIETLRAYINMFLQDPAYVEAIARAHLDHVQIIYSNDNVEYNKLLTNMLQIMHEAFSSATQESNLILKRLNENYPSEASMILDEYNSFIQNFNRFNKTLKSFHKPTK